MTSLAELTSQCASNEFLLEKLEGGVLTPRERKEIEAHIKTCSVCSDHWCWIQWSSGLIGRALEDRPMVDPTRVVRRMLVEDTQAKLARAFDQIGKRLLIATGGAKHRVVFGKTATLRVSVDTANGHLRTLEKLDKTSSLRHLTSLVRRVSRLQPSAPSAVDVAADVLVHATELDPVFPQPIIRLVQLQPPGQTLASVERATEEVLRISDDPWDRSLILSDLATAQLRLARDLSAAAETIAFARTEDPHRPEIVAYSEIVKFLIGVNTRERLEHALVVEFKHGRRRSQLGSWLKTKRAISGSLTWFRVEQWLDRRGERELRGAFAGGMR